MNECIKIYFKTKCFIIIIKARFSTVTINNLTKLVVIKNRTEE